MPLQADLRPIDHQRGYRLLIAWLDGDKFAMDVVLDETMRDENGTPGVLFWLASFAASLGARMADDFTGQLRAALLAAASDDDT